MLTEEELYCTTAKVISTVWEGSKPGKGGKYIYMKFDHMPFRKGEHITYDLRDGVILHIEQVSGDLLTARVIAIDIQNAWCPQHKLEKDVVWIVLGRVKVGEYT